MAVTVEMFDVPGRRLLGAELVPPRRLSALRFKHTFGGPAKHRGIVPAGCRRPLVLLYTFDLADPLLTFLRSPSLPFLPLYCPFFTASYSHTYRSQTGIHVGYQVMSASEIKILAEQVADYDGGSESIPSSFRSTG
jgi:hypothetical protein